MTFLDFEIPGLIGARRWRACLLFTCIGVPAYRNRSGGAAGDPVRLHGPQVTRRAVRDV